MDVGAIGEVEQAAVRVPQPHARSPRSTPLPSNVAVRSGSSMSSRISRPLWAKNSTGLRQTTRSMSSSSKPAVVHRVRGLAHLQRVRHAPVARRVDDDPLGAVLLRARAPSGARPSSCPGRSRSRPSSRRPARRATVSSLLWSITHHLRRDAGGLDELDRLARAGGLVAVRRVHEHRQLVLDGQRELREQRLLLGRRHRVEADLARRRRRRPWPGSAAGCRSPRGAGDRRWPPSGSGRSCSDGGCRTAPARKRSQPSSELK